MNCKSHDYKKNLLSNAFCPEISKFVIPDFFMFVCSWPSLDCGRVSVFDHGKGLVLVLGSVIIRTMLPDVLSRPFL